MKTSAADESPSALRTFATVPDFLDSVTSAAVSVAAGWDRHKVSWM